MRRCLRRLAGPDQRDVPVELAGPLFGDQQIVGERPGICVEAAGRDSSRAEHQVPQRRRIRAQGHAAMIGERADDNAAVALEAGVGEELGIAFDEP
ncbi:MAG TPA: hypothetical protein VLK25_13310 [Allosphingosinicella sp.]|nr:hypothetical protein [Allosphingosinicella sp.]